MESSSCSSSTLFVPNTKLAIEHISKAGVILMWLGPKYKCNCTIIHQNLITSSVRSVYVELQQVRKLFQRTGYESKFKRNSNFADNCMLPAGLSGIRENEIIYHLISLLSSTLRNYGSCFNHVRNEYFLKASVV